MKKLLVLLFIAFFMQSQAQTANEYLNICFSTASKTIFVYISYNGNDFIEKTYENSGYNYNYNALINEIKNYEKEGWELLDVNNTCAFMKREVAKEEE